MHELRNAKILAISEIFSVMGDCLQQSLPSSREYLHKRIAEEQAELERLLMHTQSEGPTPHRQTRTAEREIGDPWRARYGLQRVRLTRRLRRPGLRRKGGRHLCAARC